MRKLVIGCVVAAALAVGGGGAASAQDASETAPNCEEGLLTALAAPGSEERSDTATLELTEQLLECGFIIAV